MGKQFRARTFKSGNSVALRLPAGLGVEPGREMLVDGDAEEFAVKQVPEPKRRIDLTGIWGAAPGLTLPPREDFEERPSSIEARSLAAEHGAAKH